MLRLMAPSQDTNMKLVKAIKLDGRLFLFDKLEVRSIEEIQVTSGQNAPSKEQVKSVVQLNFKGGGDVRIRARLEDVRDVIEKASIWDISDLEKK